MPCRLPRFILSRAITTRPDSQGIRGHTSRSDEYASRAARRFLPMYLRIAEEPFSACAVLSIDQLPSVFWELTMIDLHRVSRLNRRSDEPKLSSALRTGFCRDLSETAQKALAGPQADDGGSIPLTRPVFAGYLSSGGQGCSRRAEVGGATDAGFPRQLLAGPAFGQTVAP